MAKLTYAQLKEVVATYIDENNIAVDSFTATKENSAGLTDKIGAIITLDNTFVDKLAIFDGMDLEWGKTIEEWYEDLILPIDYDSTGAHTLAPSDPSYRPVEYSYTLGRKVFKTTRRFDDLERAVNNESQFVELVSKITKRLYDSFTSFKYACKRQALGLIGKMCVDAMTASTVYATGTAYSVNTVLKKSASSNVRGIVFSKITTANDKTWDDAVKAGLIVELDLVSTLAMPVDTNTGEAFIKQIKIDAEKAGDESQGHSLNGNSLGVVGSLVLVLNHGIMPSLDVDTLAGAFHVDKLAYNAETVAIPDFGTNEGGIYAILCDARIMRMCKDYQATRTQENAEGDFINYVQHLEATMHISRNCFVKVYKSA